MGVCPRIESRRTWGRRPAGFRLPTVSEESRQRSQRRFLPAYGKPLRASNREFNGTDGLRTYIRIVPLSLRQALLARPQRLPPVAGAGRPIARALPIGDAIDLSRNKNAESEEGCSYAVRRPDRRRPIEHLVCFRQRRDGASLQTATCPRFVLSLRRSATAGGPLRRHPELQRSVQVWRRHGVMRTRPPAHALNFLPLSAAWWAWPTCYWLDPVANADPSSLVKSASVDRPDRATSIRVMAHKPRQIKVW